jgi:uncharacterized membrane protein
MRRLILVFALALSACGRGGDKDPNAPLAAPDVAADFRPPIDAIGSDPQWGLKIRGQQLTLSQANQPDLTGTAPGAVIQPHQASWTAALPDGRTLKVSLFASPCADIATGVTYPFSAEVLLPGATPLDGCAGKPAGAATASAASAAKR